MFEVRLPKKWHVRPGQYLQLWIPRGGGLRASIQLPSFVVTYWKNHQDSRTIYLLGRPVISLVRNISYEIAVILDCEERIGKGVLCMLHWNC